MIASINYFYHTSCLHTFFFLIENLFRKDIKYHRQLGTRKNSEPQMGFEPMTLHDLVRCSNR